MINLKALQKYADRLNKEKLPNKHDSRKATRHPIETGKFKLKTYGIADAMNKALRNKK